MKTKNGSNILTKKNVSYMPLPTRYGYGDTDEENNPENGRKIDHYTALKLNTGAASVSMNLTESSVGYEKEEILKHEKTARNRLLVVSGHRRAESLGCVGQGSRNMVKSPDVMQLENHESSNEKIHSKF